jgi:hypothetical protein
VLETGTIVFSCLGIVLFLLGQQAILTGLIISSIFQATAFINIGGSPIIVYYFFGVLFVLRGVVDLFWLPLGWRMPKQNNPLLYLLGFVLIAVLGAFILPQIFYGTLVYSPKISIDDQFNNMTRLALESQHFNQSIQLLVNALIFVIIWFRIISPLAFIRAIVFSLVFALGIGQLTVKQQVAGFQKIALGGQLFDGVTTVKQLALVAVDIGNFRVARRGRKEARIESEFAGLPIQLSNVNNIRAHRTLIDRKLDGRAAIRERQRGGLFCAHGSIPC